MKRSAGISRFLILLTTICGLVLICSWNSPAWSGTYDFLKHVNTATYPSAHCVLSREVEHISVKKDGTYLDKDEVFITVLDEKGKRRQQVQHFYMNRNYSRLKIIKMEVTKPDGSSVDVDLEKNSSLTDPSSSSRMNIYDPNLKVMNVFIPGLNPGDTIHYIVEVDNFKSTIEGQFFARSLIQQTFPVRSISLQVELPAGKELHYLIKDRCKGSGVKFTRHSAHGLIRYSWQFDHVSELVPEPYMPDVSRVAMRLLLSTLSSWKDVSRWYYNLVEPKLKINDAIRAEVKRLTEGRKTAREKQEALFFFVARNIRYLGIIEEANRPGFEPHDVTLTFERRYGVCRDKAALLVAMLRQAGFHAAPVIMSAGRKLDPEIPVPYFNHAIVAVLDDAEKPEIYMDPTSETSRQLLPDYEQDSSCLPAVYEGSDLLQTPVKAPDSNLFVMEIRDRLDSGGVLQGDLRASASGFTDTAFRGILMRKARDQQERFLKVFLLRRQPRLKIREISWTDPADRRKNFSFHCRFSLPDALRRSGFLFPFSSAGAMGFMDNFLFKRVSMISRTYPLKMGYTFKTLVREEIKLDVPCYQIVLPETTHIEDSFLKYQTGYFVLKQGVSIQQQLSIKRLEIPPDEYHNLLEVQARLGAAPLNPMFLVPCRQE